ncbi:hypothetical protein CPA56_02755 [Bombella sp. TMW2.1889]|uniref:Uncharacterized protein n=2 Tax=Bombella mellum TaxID=2039288 RepID=A0ABR5ZRP8_9PROT|nr:hypothetical protein [Bombella mellum]
MKLKTVETLISIIVLYISLFILYYSGFFKFNIKDDNIYKIIPSIITAFTALYVGYEARKITREQKDIAEDKLALDLFEKRMKFHVALCNYIISLEIFYDSISTYRLNLMCFKKKILDNLEKLLERNNKLTEEKITASFIYPDDQIKKIDEIFSLKNELPIMILKTNYNINQKDKIKNTIEDMNKIKNELERFIKNERLKIR